MNSILQFLIACLILIGTANLTVLLVFLIHWLIDNTHECPSRKKEPNRQMQSEGEEEY